MKDAQTLWPRVLVVAALVVLAGSTLGFAEAQPSLEQRVRDLEQYHQNLGGGRVREPTPGRPRSAACPARGTTPG